MDSGGVLSPRQAGLIPRLYPWVHCVFAIINQLRNFNCNSKVDHTHVPETSGSVEVKINRAVPPEDLFLSRRLFWALN